MLGRSTAVQGNRRNAGITRNLGGFQERNVVVVDALTHLNGQRNVVAGGFPDRRLHDRGEQIGLPGQGGATASAGHLGGRATKVQVDVVGSVLFDDHAHSLADVDRVDAVNLDGADLLVRVMLNNAHGLGFTLHEGARSHHFGHVQAATVFAAEAAESLIGHAGHGGEDHGGVNGQFAQLQGRKSQTGCFRIHPYIVAYGGKSGTGLSYRGAEAPRGGRRGQAQVRTRPRHAKGAEEHSAPPPLSARAGRLGTEHLLGIYPRTYSVT